MVRVDVARPLRVIQLERAPRLTTVQIVPAENGRQDDGHLTAGEIHPSNKLSIIRRLEIVKQAIFSNTFQMRAQVKFEKHMQQTTRENVLVKE